MVIDAVKPERKKSQAQTPAGPTIIAARYHLEYMLGQSPNAKVYRAIDLKENRPVALKLFFKKLERDPNFIVLFRKEVRSNFKLNHPGIVQTVDYGYDPQGYFLVNQYVESQNLQTLLKNQGKLDSALVAGIVIRLCEALHYAHQLGVTHRDLKPQNVLLDGRGMPHLVDFGLARAVANTGLTLTGHMMGSVGYLAPEQIQNGALTHQTDMYTLGVMMFEMVTGRLPFEGDADLLVALDHVRKTPPRPSQYNPKVPANFEGVIMRCLAKDPAERFPSHPLLKAALQNCLQPGANPTHNNSWGEQGFGSHNQLHLTPNLSNKSGNRKGLLVAGILSALILIVLAAILLNVSGLLSQRSASVTATPANSTVPPATTRTNSTVPPATTPANSTVPPATTTAPVTTPATTTVAAVPTEESVPTTVANGGSEDEVTATPQPTTNPPATTAQPTSTVPATTPAPTVPATSSPGSPTPEISTGKEIRWLAINGPVKVDGNLVVGPGETLVIEPGVTVRMGPNANLTVAGGKLEAKGTTDHPIIFTSAQAQPKPGSWGELVISGGGEAILSQVEFSYGGGASGWFTDPKHPVVLVTNGQLEMTDSTITRGGGPALVVRSFGRGFATGSIFSQNASSEIINDSGNFTLSNNK